MKRLVLFGLATFALSVSAADITVSKPYFRWLFNGFGFQHSEASFLRIMNDELRDQRVLKTFRELSPSFGRVYTAQVNLPKEQLDAFADFYDLTFRQAGTSLYVCPGRLPPDPDSYDSTEYAEKVATNLKYLIKERGCRKLRFYCLCNELVVGDVWEYFKKSDERKALYIKMNAALFNAFRRQGLDICLLATDEACTRDPSKILPFYDWTVANMNEYVGAYCNHWYVYGRQPEDLSLWNDANQVFSNLVWKANGARNKRFILGEWGFSPTSPNPTVPMKDDTGYSLRVPEKKSICVLSKCEVGLAAMNQGTMGCVSWSFVDYPDPYIIEDGDTPEEKARYHAALCGYNMDRKYNKWGAFRWCDVDRDYRAYDELYAYGWIVKLFRKNATVLPMTFADSLLRGGAVLNADGSVSIAIINRGEARTATLDVSALARCGAQPAFRRIVYDSANVPHNAFNDLQRYTDLVAFGKPVALPARSIVFLTTDYKDVTPEAIEDLEVENDVLSWPAAKDENHRYYRVYRDGKQIASTVATSLKVGDADEDDFTVTSVDKWNNEGRK